MMIHIRIILQLQLPVLVERLAIFVPEYFDFDGHLFFVILATCKKKPQLYHDAEESEERSRISSQEPSPDKTFYE